MLARVLCWLVPAVLTGFVVAYQAAVPEPWRDEIATWSAARRSAGEILAMGQHIDGVTVPYYLLAHWSMAVFGNSMLALRIPSMAAMTATAAVTALLARRLWGVRPALLAGLIVAVLPVISRYAQEARGYAFAALFAVLSTLLLVRALEWSRWARWVSYATSLILLGLSHQIALLLLLGHLVTVVATSWRRLLWWGPSVLLGVAAVVPFARLGLGQRGAQLDWLSAANPADLAEIAGTIFLSGVLGGAVCALAALALRNREWWGVLMVLTAVLPVFALYAIDQLITPMFVGRYLIFVVPLLCALAGRGLALLRLPLGLTVVVVLALIGLPLQATIRRTHSAFDYRAAADLIQHTQQLGDAIVYAPRDGWQFTDLAMTYYAGSNLPRDVLLQADELRTESLWATECPDTALCFATVDRVWTLSADSLETGRRAGVTDQLSPPVRAILTSSFDQLMQSRVEGFTIGLFARRPAEPDPQEPSPAYRHWGPGPTQTACCID
ncbi:glycosyltransferase family 39 protein [Actinoplanes sp. TFC3]|uniref:glycosyltransferase family 39 protein n=1 Tax=Actinoplanes sp. TFC3 TaxID=1710355 RepID=UPI00082CC97B|nr:glycosyltransferase family 39 protein [Actinoplanes sp. TFC3]